VGIVSTRKANVLCRQSLFEPRKKVHGRDAGARSISKQCPPYNRPGWPTCRATSALGRPRARRSNACPILETFMVACIRCTRFAAQNAVVAAQIDRPQRRLYRRHRMTTSARTPSFLGPAAAAPSWLRLCVGVRRAQSGGEVKRACRRPRSARRNATTPAREPVERKLYDAGWRSSRQRNEMLATERGRAACSAAWARCSR